MPLNPPHSLRHRYSALTAVLLLGVMVLFAGAAFVEVRKSAIAASGERLESVTRYLGDLLSSSVAGIREQARARARQPDIRSFLGNVRPWPADSLAAVMRRIAPPTGTLASVELWDADGSRRFSSNSDAPLEPDAARSLMDLTRGDDTAAVGWLRVVRDTILFPTIVRVADSAKTLGYLVTWRRQTSTAQVQRQFAELIGSNARLFLGNTRGDVWTDLGQVVQAPSLPLGQILQGVVSVEEVGGAHLAAARPIVDSPWTVVVEFPRGPVLARAYALLRELGVIAVLLLLVAAGSAWALSGSLTRPISELAAASTALSAGDYSSRVSSRVTTGRRDELGALGTAFNEMAQKIADSRHELEENVRELATSEARYRLLFERNPLPMWVYASSTLRFLAVNDAAVRDYGYTHDEFQAMTILDIRPAEDVPGLLDELSRVLPSSIDRRSSRHRRRDGSLIEVELSSHELVFDGTPSRLVLSHDVTARRRSEAALRAAQDRLEHVLASSRAVIYRLPLADGAETIDWISENVTRLFGYEVSEASAPGWWWGTVHPADRDGLAVDGGPRPPRDVTREYRIRRKDGIFRWVRDEQRVISDAEGRPREVVGVWLDITEHRQLEDQFRQAQKLDAVGRLAGGVAHDFNNLLTVILAECDMALADALPNDPVRVPLGDIRQAGERAAHLTRQLLTFSRRQLVEPTVFSCNDLVREMNRMLRRLIGEDMELRIRQDPQLGLVRADRGQIEQVLVNLVVNARDAMPAGGLLVIETANVALDADYARSHAGVVAGDYIMLAVSDSGTGITPDVKAHLFEPFFTTKEPGKGTGLGLATCYAIARQFGGHIVAYSEVERGTTMKVYFPRAYVSALVTESLLPVAIVGGNETILLVEDDPQVRAVGARVLRSRGYTVIEANDGIEALDLLRAQAGTLDLLLTDVVLPRMGGRELAERTLVVRPAARVLYTSGYTEDVILKNRLVEHGISLLHKPFSSDSLLRKVRETLDRSPASAASPNSVDRRA